MRKTLSILAIFTFTIITFQASAQITEIGLASFYADKFHGRVTASGEIFDQKKMTAAHRTLPFGSKVKVTNIKNKKSIVVIINDRGPFVKDRVIDLSKEGAKRLDFIADGVTQVKVEVISLGKAQPGTQNTNTNKSQKPKSKPTAASSTAVNTEKKPSAVAPNKTIANTAIEYYKLESELIEPTGFGIQVASYQEAANLMKRVAEIKKHINKDVLIQVGNSNGSKVYRIIIGTFNSKESATSYNQSIQNKFNGSFVISF